MRVHLWRVDVLAAIFPFLFGGTFIEGNEQLLDELKRAEFPFLFGGTFIEGRCRRPPASAGLSFPFLFGGTFIEGLFNGD